VSKRPSRADGTETEQHITEDILSRDARVHAAVMFGRGRFQNGVLVQPKPDHVFDTADVEALASFRNTIWYVLGSPARFFE
jgi:hypothetical protein